MNFNDQGIFNTGSIFRVMICRGSYIYDTRRYVNILKIIDRSHGLKIMSSFFFFFFLYRIFLERDCKVLIVWKIFFFRFFFKRDKVILQSLSIFIIKKKKKEKKLTIKIHSFKKVERKSY